VLELICIKKLLESRGALPEYCVGRKDTICCIECRREREHEPATEQLSNAIEALENGKPLDFVIQDSMFGEIKK